MKTIDCSGLAPASRVRPVSRMHLALVLILAAGVPQGVRAQAAAPATTPDPSTSANTAEETVRMSVFEVTEEGDTGYRATQTLAGASTVALIRDLPSSVSVMNREFMEDLMITDIVELSSYYISGEAEPVPELLIPGGNNVRMRGIPTGNLRDGIYFAVNLDAHSIDRVEVLRGPQGFLYTGAGAGGTPNQVTKQAFRRNAEELNLMFGSYNLHRAEVDVNRVLTDKLAVRTSLAYQDADAFANHASRKFYGGLVTTNYRPFAGTNINLSLDYGKEEVVMSPNILSDQFDTSDRTGATTAYSLTTGGYTFVPAADLYYDSVGLRRTSGTNLAITDRSFMNPEMNLKGPNNYNDSRYISGTFTFDQRVSEDFNLQAIVHHMKVKKKMRQTIGSSQASVYRDVNPSLPDGSPNPYFNEFYTEYSNRYYNFDEPTEYYRLAGVYDLKLPFMTQRLIGTVHHHTYEAGFLSFSEFVDPSSPQFRGTLINENSLEAYQANLTTQNQNRFYRRFYLRDGDSADFTAWEGPIAGRSIMMRDITADGANGRFYYRKYWNHGGSLGATGKYFNDRVHTFVGWRSDSFNWTPGRIFNNVLTGQEYTLITHPRGSALDPKARVRGDSTNYGLVYHAFKFLSFYANYGESVSLNVAAGSPGLFPGVTIPSPKGFGEDYGLRWSFLGGAIESNWTYYKNNRLAGAAIPALVRMDELAILFDDINPSASDTQTVTADGIEFDTIVTLSQKWRLMWNFSSNDLSNTDRYPAVKAVQARARAQNLPTPETDAFLETVPEGTPSPGFTKVRSNLVTTYRFTDGPLKNVLVGGGAQYRDVTYQGNYDLDRDGVAEELWSPSYIVWNLMLGYRTQLWDRRVDFSLNVNNIFDKEYFMANRLNTGGWGPERSFRFGMRVEL